MWCKFTHQMGKFVPLTHFMLLRLLSAKINEALKDTPVIIITGARQTGKSTLCRQLLEDKIFTGSMVTLDDPTTLSVAISDPLGFLQAQDKHLIIDEVQRAPEIFLSLKKLVDEDRENRRYILTGSADVMSLPRVADSLAGRTETLHLWPLSENEIEGTTSAFLENLLSSTHGFKDIELDWGELLSVISRGGYPEAVKRETESRRASWFKSYLDAIIQKDIRELSNIEGLSQIPNILQLLSARVGSLTNLSEIARLSGIKNTTLQRYMSLLEFVFLIVKIPAWTPNFEGSFVKSPKVYLSDTGLLSHLRGETPHSLTENKTVAGSFLENFVVMEIIKQISASDLQLKPFHFSKHKGEEVDLVLEDARKKLYGIEIKSKSSLSEADFKGLKKFADLAGNRFVKGIVLYNGKQVLGGFGGKGLLAVPISNLWK